MGGFAFNLEQFGVGFESTVRQKNNGIFLARCVLRAPFVINVMAFVLRGALAEVLYVYTSTCLCDRLLTCFNYVELCPYVRS